ncbi:MAG: amino acid adenylation domain-containing protein, partial [Clostridia bacterium]|nr:amino acid adenylation domain-containing protein [Clostridia bacterium]
MKNAVTSPDAKLCEISALTEAEKHTITFEFNNTEIKYPKHRTVVDLFEEQVEKTPENIAVITGNTELTYTELNNRANMIANYLVERGVKENDVITILMPRDEYLMPAILGVLKTGATYLPIATNLPEDRIRYIAEDSKSAFVLTESEYCTESYVGDVEGIDVRKIACSSTSNPRVKVMPDAGSYIIYTSGSTGKPKGTILTQQSLYNFCANNLDVLESIKSAQNPRMLSTTTISFDIFVTESLMSICNGICSVIADEEEQVMQSKVSAVTLNKQCTAMQTTPSKMRMYMEDADNCEYLRNFNTIILGGEVFPRGLYLELRKYTDANIFNIYGPSEATVWITTKNVRDENVNIGKPYSNTQIYILNNGNLCGIGMPGELCVAGDNVGLGYLNRPELTAEKFIDNPFGEGKMYLTGDLARWLPDGNIEYMGRIDDQIKIRGLRIELGEIESVLRTLNEIKDCAVIARNDASGEKAIYAYLVSDEEISLSAVRDRLSASLPEYMIPSYMGQIDMIPVNANGKLDRKALPELEATSTREY